MRHHGFRLGLVLATALFASSWAAGQGKGKGGQHANMHQLHGQNNLQEAILHKEVELELADNVVVRRKYPPDQRDENGKLRRPTPAELKELKGPDPKAFGYSADLFDLKSGQQIQVTLLRRKDDKSPAKPANNNDTAKPAADKKNVDNAGNEWVFAGTLAGTLTATPHSTKKDSNNKITLRVDSVTTTQGHHSKVHQGKNKKTTMPDVKVSQIVILSKDLPPKEAPAKNN